MDAWKIIVAAAQSDDEPALVAQLRAAWSHERALVIETVSFEALDSRPAPGPGAVVEAVIVVPPDELKLVRALITEQEERGLPVLVAHADTAAVTRSLGQRVWAFDPNCDLTHVADVLLGLIHGQSERRRLRRDLAIADRCHGGLQGEIDRMHDELQLAAMVQREFLPRTLPALHGVHFSALWRPANYVSGDIYDITRLDDDHIGVFIADAVGHGVPAALMTMVICRSITTKEIRGNAYRLLEPREVLDGLNRDMVARQGAGLSTRFATAVYAVVNCRSRTMRLAGAGHPPPMLFSHDGTCRELETSGGLLGIFPDEEYDQINVELAIGDRLLLHSDGFEQAFPEPNADAYNRRLPSERYREEFAQIVREPTPDDMIEVICHRIDDQAGSLHQADDLTLICMETGPVPVAATVAA